MTKDTGDFRQFRSVACREHTLPRDDPASQPKGWIQGDMRIGPLLEVTTSFQYGKHGIEIRIWSLSHDNSQSWVRISYGTVKFNYVFQPCNDTFQFGEIVPTSYDEYTALVKSGNVASKHVNGWRVRSKRQI